MGWGNGKLGGGWEGAEGQNPNLSSCALSMLYSFLMSHDI